MLFAWYDDSDFTCKNIKNQGFILSMTGKSKKWKLLIKSS